MSDTNIIYKRWVEDGNAVIADAGFVPSVAIMLENTGGTNPDIYIWTQEGEDTDSRYALKITGSSGIVTRVTSAASGLAKYDTKLQGVNVPNPGGAADNFRIPEVYSTTQNYTSTYTQSQTGNTVTWAARSATAAGGIVYPTTRNGYCYELTTASGAGTTEPTWGTTIGGTTTDGGSNVWTCRVANVVTNGVAGLTVGASIQTDGQITELIMIEASNAGTVNVGDVANLTETDFA